MLNLEVRRLEKEARQRLADFTGAMERNPQEARRVLEALVSGPLRFTPVETTDGKHYKIDGEVGLDAMLTAEGIAGAVPFVSPAGLYTLGRPETSGNLLSRNELPRLVA